MIYRSLLHFPIVHTQADLGGLGEQVRRLKVNRLGRRGWERSVKRIDQLWNRIEKAIDGLPLSFERVRVYQDGLPNCGRELEIVAELAAGGSRNHRLLLELHQKGAALMGTESPELLLAEYRLAASALPAGRGRRAVRDSLLERRDRCIAARINCTLLREETGILFLGLFHTVAPLLAPDIRVVYPLGPAVEGLER